jgi:hypothetical protein
MLNTRRPGNQPAQEPPGQNISQHEESPIPCLRSMPELQADAQQIQ